MEVSPGKYKDKQESSSQGQSFYEEKPVDFSEKFQFLKEKLEAYHKGIYQKTLRKLQGKQTKLQDQLYLNLQLLLNEILYIKHPEDREKMIEKTFNWYLSKLENKNTASQSPSKFEKSAEVFIPKEKQPEKTCESEVYRKSQVVLPKSLVMISRENLVDKINSSYHQMIRKEKLDFQVPLVHGSAKNTGKTFSAEKATSSKDLIRRSTKVIDAKQQEFSESPLKTPCMDFRKVAHKFRMIKPVKIDRELEQIPLRDAEEIFAVKKALSNEGFFVEIRTLENALCVNRKVVLNTFSKKRFPVGGEKLLHSPARELVKLKSMTPTPKQKTKKNKLRRY